MRASISPPAKWGYGELMFPQPEAGPSSLEHSCWEGGCRFGLNLVLRFSYPLGSQQWGHLVGSQISQSILGPHGSGSLARDLESGLRSTASVAFDKQGPL